MTTVLVVDDNPLDRRLAGGFVEQAGMAAMYAEDGLQAMEMLSGTLPDIVLTDLDMPYCDGLELVREAKRLYPTLPVILMTAKGSEEIAVEALTSGASSYVPKRNMRQELIPALKIVAQAAKSRRQRQQVYRFMTSTVSQFVLGNDGRGTAALVSYLQDMLRVGNICDEGELIRIGTALSEALINAIEHGNLELDSRLRGDKNPSAYSNEARKRMSESPYMDRCVFVISRVTKTEAVFTIRDEGHGFDPSSLPDPTNAENIMSPYGRGLMLIRTFMDEVSLNEIGNEITMHKYAQPES